MIVVVVFVLVLAAYLLSVGRRRHDDLRLPPGPRPWPVIGNLLELDAREPHVALTRLAARYGPVFGLQLGQVYAVVLADADVIRETLRCEGATGRAPLFVTHGIMGGYGLICSEGALWKDQRRLSIGWLKTLGMVKHGDGAARQRLLASIQRNVDESIAELLLTHGRAIDPQSTLLHTMGNIMNELVFGRRYTNDDPTWMYLQHLQEEGVKHIGVSGAVNFLPWLRHLPGQSRVIRFLLEGKDKTHEIYDRIVSEVRTEMQKKTANPSNIIELFLRERDARLDAGEQERMQLCSDQQLRHLLADLFGAGLDTTLTTLRWFLLYVARDPLVQQRIADEMDAHLTTEPVDSDRCHLPYLRAALAETQRIRSVVPLGIPHGLSTPTEIAGWRLPVGTMVIPLQWAVHMDPVRWPQPERFRPERFIDAHSGEFKIEAGAAFLPFQSGKRMCPGEELAQMMLFAFASRMLYAFELRAPNTGSMDGECGITLTPPRNLEIEFAVRGRRSEGAQGAVE